MIGKIRLKLRRFYLKPKSILMEKDMVKLKFTNTQEIEIPINEIPKEKLNKSLDKMIGVLKCFHHYKIRALNNKKSRKNWYRKPNINTV